MLKVVLTKCVKCGAETEWEYVLGGEPLCVDCWDSEAEKIPTAQRVWQLRNIIKWLAYLRAYREFYRDEILAKQRWRYRLDPAGSYARTSEYSRSHRDELNAWRRDYYKRNREKIREQYRRWYYKNKERKLVTETKGDLSDFGTVPLKEGN